MTGRLQINSTNWSCQYTRSFRQSKGIRCLSNSSVSVSYIRPNRQTEIPQLLSCNRPAALDQNPKFIKCNISPLHRSLTHNSLLHSYIHCSFLLIQPIHCPHSSSPQLIIEVALDKKTCISVSFLPHSHR